MKAEIKTQNHSGQVFRNQLFESCKNGDPRAQLQVYKLYYKPIYQICLLIENEPAKAEDLMHESFLMAFEDISSYNENTSFPAWLGSYIKHAFRRLSCQDQSQTGIMKAV